MDDQMQNDHQQEPIYNSYVSIQDVARKNFRERWTIEMCERDPCWQRDMMIIMMVFAHILLSKEKGMETKSMYT